MSEPEKNHCPKCQTPIPENAPHGLCPKCVMADVSAVTQEDTRVAAQRKAPDLKDLTEAFPEFDIKELIGQGGMGFVYRAHQNQLDRDVALKVLPESLAEQPGFSERFSREGRLLAKLSHQNIVTVFDFGKNGPFYYLLMEYVDGVNLRQAMQAGRFTPEQALVVVPKVCEALQFAHEQGVLHRDIKPENILMDGQGEIKIADFGIAKLVGESGSHAGLTRSGAAVGTPHYMAPEQVTAAANVDHRADIYSLGVVFYELLTGELPLGRFEPPSSRTPLDARLDEVVLRALERDRERRQQSASEIKTQVEQVAEPGQAAATVTQSGSSMSARERVFAPAIALAFVGLVNFVRIFPGTKWSALSQSNDSWTEAFLSPFGILMLTITGFLAYAAHLMARLEHRSVALLGGVVATISFPWTMVGFPIGIWVLNVLHHPTVKSAFPDSPHPRPQSENPWPRRIFYLVIAIIVVPVVLLGLSLLVAAWSYSEAKAPDAPASPAAIVAEADATNALQASLENGGFSLQGLAKHPNPRAQWYRPDGSPFANPGITNTTVRVRGTADHQAYEFLFRTDQLPEGARLGKWQAEPAFESTGIQQLAPHRQQGEKWMIVAGTLPPTTTEIDLNIQLARAPFVTLAQCDSSPLLEGQSSNQAGEYEGLKWEVTFAASSSNDSETTVILAHNVKDWDVRVVAETDDGTLHPATRWQTGSQHLTASFQGLGTGTIQTFHLQARPYERVRFNDIQLPQ